jgi:hypothetical protein
MRERLRPIGRKLLVASIGVGTLSYVGVQCGGSETTGPSADASPDLQTTGNLAPPVDARASSSGASSSGGSSSGASSSGASSGGSSSGGADGATGSDATSKDAPSTDGSGKDATGKDARTFDAIDDFPVANLVAFPPEGGSDAKKD